MRTLSAVPVLARHVRSLRLPLLVIERIAQERVIGVNIGPERKLHEVLILGVRDEAREDG